MDAKAVRTALLAMGLTVGLTLLPGCQSPPRAARPPAAPPPEKPRTATAAPSPSTPAPGEARQPDETDSGSITANPATVSPTTAEAPEDVPPAAIITPPLAPTPADEPPKLPAYLKVVERFHPSERAYVDARITSSHRLVIDTRNVRRLRIDRHRLPMATGRSIVLRLDGQGIEWTAGSTTEEFERSDNGIWMPVKKRIP